MSAVTPKPDLDRNEAELIRRICGGEKELFYELVQPYERAVFAAAMSILGNQADAEEASQEAVLKALSHLSSFRSEAKFSTWLITIAINEARLKLRKDRRHLYESVDEPNSNEEGDYFPKDFADWREIPSESLRRKELRDALKRAETQYCRIHGMRRARHIQEMLRRANGWKNIRPGAAFREGVEFWIVRHHGVDVAVMFDVCVPTESLMESEAFLMPAASASSGLN